MCAFISIRALEHAYELPNGASVRALRGVSLEIGSGEFVALIGPNGSGKSTLARHLNALLLPISGDVLINGMSTSDARNTWSIRQQVGMVFQNPENQIVASTVEEDVAFGPENAGLPRDEIRRRVDQALGHVGMQEHARRPVHTLSGGQKQRVAIAGVLAMRPSCIVLDEPTSMLDPFGQRQTMETIQSLNRDEGITIVLITQSMDEAAMARRVIAMEDGGVILDGPPTEVFKNTTVLSSAGLGLPVGGEIAASLRDLGFAIPTDVLTVERLASLLC